MGTIFWASVHWELRPTFKSITAGFCVWGENWRSICRKAHVSSIQSLKPFCSRVYLSDELSELGAVPVEISRKPRWGLSRKHARGVKIQLTIQMGQDLFEVRNIFQLWNDPDGDTWIGSGSQLKYQETQMRFEQKRPEINGHSTYRPNEITSVWR